MKRLVLGLLGILLVFGLVRAAQLAWTCDDAFISLRYAQNLLAGHGLVYNAGERVEGYTNLLWTLLLAGLMRLGIPDLAAASGAGIACYAWLALALARTSWRRAREEGLPFLPLAAGLVLVSDDFHVWATGGLETLLFTALALEALLRTRRADVTLRAALGTGVLLSLLVATRPDGLLLAGAAAVSQLLPPARGGPRRRLRLALALLLPLALFVAALAAWKLAYYGELLPTAFYSKSAVRPYPSQGLVYVGLYLAKNWFLTAAALALAVAATRGERLPEASRWDERCLLGSAALYTAYIVWVGGDFMFARRLLPVVPLVLLVIENRVVRWSGERVRVAAAAALLLAAALPLPIFARSPRIHFVGEEERVYTPEILAARRRQGEVVGAALRGTPVRVAFEGGMCMFGYYSRLPYLAEITGLTQYSLAKRPLAERGVVGHEKVADGAWLTENDIHLVVSQALPPVPRPPDVLAVDEVYFGDVARARIHIYSDAVMDPLRERPEVDFVPIERVVRSTAARMRRVPLAEALALYRELRRYYFDGAGPRGEAWDRELRGILAERRTAGGGS